MTLKRRAFLSTIAPLSAGCVLQYPEELVSEGDGGDGNSYERSTNSTMDVTTDYDSGGGCSVDVDENTVEVTVEEDTIGTDGYFAFQISGAEDETVEIDILNFDDIDFRRQAGSADRRMLTICEDLDDWKDWEPLIYDDDGTEFEASSDPVTVTAGPPYPYQATVDHIETLEDKYPDYVEVEVIGQSNTMELDLHVCRITDPEIDREDKDDYVFTTRLHPGEVESAYNMDGMMDWILETLDARDKTFDSVFHFMPNTNPDGIYMGYERSDDHGNDPNREFNESEPIPEVEAIQDYVLDSVEDFYSGMDMHTANGNVEPVYQDSNFTTDTQMTKLEVIADSNLFLSGIRDSRTNGTARAWFNDEFGFGFTTEQAQFAQYTIEEMEVEEGQTWMQTLATPRAIDHSVTRRVRHNDMWVLQ